MNPGDTVTLYGEEVVIVAMAGHKAIVYGTGWNGTRRVDLESLRRLQHPDKAARWQDCPWRPFVGSC